jgi:hypothetical protein
LKKAFKDYDSFGLESEDRLLSDDQVERNQEGWKFPQEIDFKRIGNGSSSSIHGAAFNREGTCRTSVRSH